MILTTEHIQKTIASYFAQKPVKKVWLFGSYARGEADEDSDVDLLIDLDRTAQVGIEYYTWFDELAEKLRKRVDIVSAGWENKFIKPYIDKDKTVIYERQDRGWGQNRAHP